eukprot:2455346-Pyramimonas_sp.AAC.1
MYVRGARSECLTPPRPGQTPDSNKQWTAEEGEEEADTADASWEGRRTKRRRRRGPNDSRREG